MSQNNDIEDILRKQAFNESMVSYMNETKVPAASFTGLTVAEGFFQRVDEEPNESGAAREENNQ